MLRFRLSFLLGSLLAPSLVFAADPTAYEVAKRANDITNGFGAQTFDSVMTLYDGGGKKTVEYKLKQFTLEGDTTMSLIRFIAPPDSNGTALLTHESKNGDEARWLYLSDLRQVKQISGSNKSSSFKGSEFAYEDLALDTLDKYDYTMLGSAKIGGRDCWHIARKAKFPDTGYSKTEACFDKEHGYVLEIIFHDRAGKKLKHAKASDYTKINGKWRPGVTEVVNVQNKKRTVLKNGNYKVGISLSPNLFTLSQLQKQ
jgi:hypothetical protein